MVPPWALLWLIVRTREARVFGLLLRTVTPQKRGFSSLRAVFGRLVLLVVCFSLLIERSRCAILFQSHHILQKKEMLCPCLSLWQLLLLFSQKYAVRLIHRHTAMLRHEATYPVLLITQYKESFPRVGSTWPTAKVASWHLFFFWMGSFMGSEDCLFQFSDLTPTLFQFGEWCIHVPQYLCKIIPFAGEAFVILVYVIKRGNLFV